MAQQMSGRQPRYKRILLKLSGEGPDGGGKTSVLTPRCLTAWRWKSASWSVSACRLAW